MRVEQTLQHFGVREHWPPLGESSAAASLRCIGAGCGPRMLVDTPSILSPEFWIGEVRHAANVHAGRYTTSLPVGAGSSVRPAVA